MEISTKLDVTNQTPAPARNPGPSWGYQFLRVTDWVLPEVIYRPLRAIGTMIAMAGMPKQRKYSREYLSLVFGRPATTQEVFHHFFAFEEALMQRLRIANGKHIECEYSPGSDDFRQWMENGGPVILGTMHVGASDMLGFQLAGKSQNPIYLVRQRVANSHDTEALSRRFGSALHFIWVNEPSEMLYALKEALETTSAVAIQCDRVEQGARTEVFEFLGSSRLFPFTIYHLALIFERPVLLSFGIPGANGLSQLYAAPRYSKIPGEPKEESLKRARDHFQGFLRLLESRLREDPYIWFNFLPLNPVSTPAPDSAK